MNDQANDQAKYVRKTDVEIHQLAIDLLAGQLFTDRHLGGDPQVLPRIFMCIGFMAPDQLKRLAEDIGERGMIYEHMRNAGPRSANGRPMFMSIKFLDSDDADRLLAKYEELKPPEPAVQETTTPT